MIADTRGEAHTEPQIEADVAIIHDWMPTLAGAERVVEQMVRVCPNSRIYTLFDFLTPAEREIVAQGREVVTSYLNRLPGVQRYYRYLLLRCTRAVEAFNVNQHELVLSSSAALAKGVLTTPDQRHIAYIHSPARYAWDLTHDYIDSIDGLAAGLKRHVAQHIMHRFRQWDIRTTPSIDCFVANSEFIRRRIWKVYRREAEVIYPPVDVSAFSLSDDEREDSYLTVSRMVPYKQIPMIVNAFNLRPNLKLKVVGDGPDMEKIRAVAGPNIELLGHLPFDEMRAEMRRAKAFVFAALEDFGISPVEAQACGTPVIALGRGGTAETVRPLEEPNPTGVWFNETTPQSIVSAVDLFEREGHAIKAKDCSDNAERFSACRFRQALHSLLTRELAAAHRY